MKGKSLNDLPPATLIAFVAGITLLGLFSFGWVLLLPGLIYPVLFVRGVVQWMNCRDDPRNANSPGEPAGDASPRR